MRRMENEKMRLRVEGNYVLGNVKCICRGDGDILISDSFFNMANITLKPFGSQVTCIAESNHSLSIVWLDAMCEIHEYKTPEVFSFYNDNGIYFYLEGKPVIGVKVLKVMEVEN